MVATGRNKIGQLDGHSIFEVTGFDVLPFSKSTIHLSVVQVSGGLYLMAAEIKFHSFEMKSGLGGLGE